VVDVSDRPDVDVRFASVKFLFRHICFTLPVKTSSSLLGRRIDFELRADKRPELITI
jgi:hypothetical protein